MNIGMLWFDDDAKRVLDEKVARAVEYYQKKYGRKPTDCYLHPSLLPEGVDMAGGVRLRSASNILIHHFWVGVADKV